MTEKVKAIKERIQEKETRSLWQKNIKDYALKCDFLQNKNAFYNDLWSANAKTSRELVQNFLNKRR